VILASKTFFGANAAYAAALAVDPELPQAQAPTAHDSANETMEIRRTVMVKLPSWLILEIAAARWPPLVLAMFCRETRLDLIALPQRVPHNPSSLLFL
jgi:hypothetical protein